MFQVIRRMVKGKVRPSPLYDDFFPGKFSAEKLMKKVWKGSLRFSPKNIIKTKLKRALWIAGGMRAPGDEEKILRKSFSQPLHLLPDLGKVGGHEGKGDDSFL